jgi:SH3-like domain-containing protein
VFACGFISVLFNGGDKTATPTPAPATRGESLIVVAATVTPLPTIQEEPPTATSEPEARAVLVQIETAAPVVEAPTAAPVVEATAIPRTYANQEGNLRVGPGTEFEIAGNVAAGEPVEVIYKNPTGDWYQLGSGAWIAAFLVSGVIADLPVAPLLPEAPVVVEVAPVVEQPVAQEQPVVIEQPAAVDNGAAFACAGGCATPPDPSCAIKGNFDGNGGDKIFHQPGGNWYDRTTVDAADGDVWFCTPDEARAAGYREAGS